MNEHGSPWPADPVLKPLDTFQCKDAILDLSYPEQPKEPEWPAVDYIVSNPPFLGDKLMRGGLGDDYVDRLRGLYKGRVPGGADLCCYWFEKARAQIEEKKCLRAGLLATQGIRGGANRKVLERIKETGDIFFAASDRPWVLNGANVHVSMVGFDAAIEQTKNLDGEPATAIMASLTAAIDVSAARRLPSNAGSSFIGDSMHGPFDLDETQALGMLRSSGNPHGRPNSDVLVPITNAAQIVKRLPDRWTVFFPLALAERAAAQYEAPFEFVRRVVKPVRNRNHRSSYRERWWLHGEARPAMLARLRPLARFVGTPRVAKHRTFLWLVVPVLPSDQIVVAASPDDYFFGVLHSRVHEVWARAQGTQLRERESGFRYTPTTCFDTFPFPWPPGEEPGDRGQGTGDSKAAPLVAAIAEAARELNQLRENWLNPPEWTKEEVLEFPGSIDGPWSRYVHDGDERGIGTVRWPRLVPRDADCARKLKERTLTNLYNQRPAWLALAHDMLDAAVFAAYGWDPAVSDEQLLESLLTLNLERANEPLGS